MLLSYQAYSPVLGMVLPSNSPGVHTLWMPVIPLQIGLVLKPGPQETVDPLPHGGGLLRGRHFSGSAGRVPRRPRGGRGGNRKLRPHDDLRRAAHR